MKRFALPLLTLLACSRGHHGFNVAAPTTATSPIYVDASATGSHDGSSWQDAYPRLEEALANAQSGAQIWIAEGSYVPQDESFSLVNGVSIYGGFAGNESSLEQRDPENHLTILSGEEHWDRIAVGSNLDTTTLLDHLVFRGAYSSHTGAALYVSQSTLTIQNCRFESNRALVKAAALFLDHSAPEISSCTFSDNESGPLTGVGAAIVIEFDLVMAPILIKNCLFEGNHAGYSGGAIQDATAAPLLISNCSFSGNSALYGSAIYSTSGIGGILSIENSLFENNTEGETLVVYDSTVRFDGSEFRANTISPGIEMPAIDLIDCTSEIWNCQIVKNGGGIVSGSSGPDLLSNLIVVNSLIAQNHAWLGVESGCAIWAGGEVQVANSTIVDNDGETSETSPLIFFGSATITNCILRNPATVEIVNGDGNAVISVSYSCVEGDYLGRGNLNERPKFVDAAAGDFRLAPFSPCSDAGNNSLVPANLTLDLIGKPRFLDAPSSRNTGVGTGAIVDMGCYETRGFETP